jgi:S-adenosylmethionine/arginine decarboxylase-like enzyme
MIGMHLLFDAVLSENISQDEVKSILSSLPTKINMKILFGPLVVPGGPENPGWTGFVIIDKSHISLHSFEESHTVSIDVYSCEKFDPEVVVNFLSETLAVTKVNSCLITRQIF